MAVIAVRIDEETKRLMKQIRIHWSEYIRSAVKAKIEEGESLQSTTAQRAAQEEERGGAQC